MAGQPSIWDPSAGTTPVVRPQTYLVEQTFYAAEGQTSFTVSAFIYTPGSGTLRVFVNGARVTGVQETSSTTFSLPVGVSCKAGDKVFVEALLEEVSLYSQDVQLREDLADKTDSAKGAGMVGAIDGASGSIFTTVAGFIAKILSSTGSGIIGFLQAGTGSVYRSVLAKLQDTVHVADKGCVGGDIDEAVQLQAAINSAAGRTLLFSPNTIYRSTEALLLPAGTTLDLNGSTLRFACIGAKSNLAVGSNCTVRNGTVENVVGTAGLEGTYQTPIIIGRYTRLVGVCNVELSKLKISTVTPQGNGIAIFGDSSNIRINDIEFPDSAYIGIPILAHWSFEVSGGAPYTGTTTHPNNIKISNIKCGELTYDAGAGWFGTSVIFLSAVYNVEVDNVTVKNIPYGKIITTYAGDWGFQFGTDVEKQLGLCGIKVSNVFGKAMLPAQSYHLNPLEVERKVWPGSVTYKNINVVSSGGGVENRGFRIEGVDGVRIVDAVTDGFYNSIYLGGTVKNLSVIRGNYKNSTAAGFESQDVGAGSSDVSLEGVRFKSSNTSASAGTPDVRLHNLSGVNVQRCKFDSPLAAWNVRADDTATRLSVDDNHVYSVLPSGTCFSFGSSSSTNIVIHYEGNTSDVAPTGGVRGGQIMVPVTASTRHGTSTMLKIVYFNNPPDRGAWNVGDICWNSSPAVGQPKGWMCTVAGTPGTWVSMGNL